MSVRRIATVLVTALALSACSGSTFSQEDAIAALQTIGVTETEATCMADSLAALQLLGAADPRASKTDAERAALVAVSARCLASDPFLESVDLASPETAFDAGDPEGTPFGETFDPAGTSAALDPLQAKQVAIDRLISSGRSISNATCIVDHLTSVEAEDLFEDPLFGLGRDPFEADALAACL
jgi:hypothetical protein